MTLDPNWGQKVTPVPSVHTPPAKVSVAALPDQTQLQAWGLGFIDGIVEKVVLAIVGVVVPGPIVDQLQNWATTLLPAQIREPLYELVDLLVTLLGPIPIVGTVAHTLADYFGLLKDATDTAQETGDNAQASADSANVGLTQLAAKVAASEAGGTGFDDTFAGPASSTMSADYSVTYSGAAGGTLGTDGANAVVTPTGSGVRKALALVVGSTFSFLNDYQAAAFVQDGAVPNIVTPTEYYLLLRANAAMTHYLYAKIVLNGCAIYKVVGGTATSLVSATEANAAGDSWLFKAGTTVDVRELLLFHNNSSTPVLQITDTAGTLSSIGGSNLLGGFGATSGQSFVPPFLTTQVPSTPVQSISLYDRLAAA